MQTEELPRVRFLEEKSLLEELNKVPEIKGGLTNAEALRARDSGRTELLAGAVKLSDRMLPRITQKLSRIAGHLGNSGPMEAYVFQSPAINAFVSRRGARTIVGLSGGALQSLRDEELDFVIGHELGHAQFGHTDFAAEYLLSTGALHPRHAMRLRAWQRAAEISADRAGLCACGSIEGAATALFKTLAGIDVGRDTFDPRAFAGQWEELEREVVEDGDRSHWQLSHPFPPLRMKAMCLFWDAWVRRGEADGERARATADREVGRMLAMMDPVSTGREEGALDPVLAPFFFWGGLHIALADGVLDPAEIERLQSVAPGGVTVESVVADPAFDPTRCVDRFRADLRARRRKLSSVELHRIIQGLIDVAAADGHVDKSEIRRLHELGRELGIAPEACDLILSRSLSKGG